MRLKAQVIEIVPHMSRSLIRQKNLSSFSESHDSRRSIDFAASEVVVVLGLEETSVDANPDPEHPTIDRRHETLGVNASLDLHRAIHRRDRAREHDEVTVTRVLDKVSGKILDAFTNHAVVGFQELDAPPMVAFGLGSTQVAVRFYCAGVLDVGEYARQHALQTRQERTAGGSGQNGRSHRRRKTSPPQRVCRIHSYLSFAGLFFRRGVRLGPFNRAGRWAAGVSRLT